MGTLYLVRHGQASFGADNYDQLSDLGQQQSQWLGRYFAAHGLKFDAVLRGSLMRHAQTWEGIVQGIQSSELAMAESQILPKALVWPGLNEYDSHAVVRTVHQGPLEKADTPEKYRDHFRLLRQGLTAWSLGQVQPEGMPTYADFKAGVHEALAHVRRHCQGPVLLVSSGGPISMTLADLMGASPQAGIELNFRMRNSAISEVDYNPKRATVVSFNTLPHLASPQGAGMVTYT